MHIAAVAPDSRGPGHEECSISDTTPNDGKKNPETDAPATTPGLNEPEQPQIGAFLLRSAPRQKRCGIVG